jgi:hypothetical protein
MVAPMVVSTSSFEGLKGFTLKVAHRTPCYCLCEPRSGRNIWSCGGWSRCFRYAQGSYRVTCVMNILSDSQCFSSLSSQLVSILFDHSFKSLKSSLGRAWTSDYGDPQNPRDFDFIYPYSPLHNIPTNQVLPPMLLMTAERKYLHFIITHLIIHPLRRRWSCSSVTFFQVCCSSATCGTKQS